MKKFIFAVTAALSLISTAACADTPALTFHQSATTAVPRTTGTWHIYRVLGAAPQNKIVLADRQGDAIALNSSVEKRLGKLKPGDTLLVRKSEDDLLISRVPGFSVAYHKEV